MKRKKLLSLILAFAMAFSLTLPAFAQSVNSGGSTSQNLTMTSSTNTGVITFEMASAGVVVLNPYQLKTTASGDTVGTYRQVYSPAVSCKNKSTFPLSIEASLTGSVPNGVTLLSAAPAATATDKQVFLYGEFGVSDDADKQPVWATAYNKSATNQVIVAAGANNGVAASKKDVAKLAATDGTDTHANYLWFKFDGAATKNPTTAWLETDTVGVAVALTLHAVVSDVYPITVTNTTTTTAKGTVTLNYDVAPEGEHIVLTVTSDATVNSKATVTVKGSANITCTGTGPTATNGCGTYLFDMPASAVTVTVKWAAA